MKLTFLRKLVTHTTTLNAYKKLIMALGDSKVNRVDALICAGLNRGEGIHGMMERLDRANQGLYRPNNFTEEETLCGLLFLRLGGSRVAELAHRSLGSPGISTLRRSEAVTPLLPSAKTPTKEEIRKNIQVAFKDTSLQQTCGYVLMIDEIKIETRPRWDNKTNNILGLCHEHTTHIGIEFCSIEVLNEIFTKIKNKEIHWASKVSLHISFTTFH